MNKVVYLKGFLASIVCVLVLATQTEVRAQSNSPSPEDAYVMLRDIYDSLPPEIRLKVDQETYRVEGDLGRQLSTSGLDGIVQAVLKLTPSANDAFFRRNTSETNRLRSQVLPLIEAGDRQKALEYQARGHALAFYSLYLVLKREHPQSPVLDEFRNIIRLSSRRGRPR